MNFGVQMVWVYKATLLVDALIRASSLLMMNQFLAEHKSLFLRNLGCLVNQGHATLVAQRKLYRSIIKLLGQNQRFTMASDPFIWVIPPKCCLPSRVWLDTVLLLLLYLYLTKGFIECSTSFETLLAPHWDTKLDKRFHCCYFIDIQQRFEAKVGRCPTS